MEPGWHLWTLGISFGYSVGRGQICPPVYNSHIFTWCCSADGVTCCSVSTLEKIHRSLNSATFAFVSGLLFVIVV